MCTARVIISAFADAVSSRTDCAMLCCFSSVRCHFIDVFDQFYCNFFYFSKCIFVYMSSLSHYLIGNYPSRMENCFDAVCLSLLINYILAAEDKRHRPE